MKSETILLGGGCFWCLEAIFKNLCGIKSVKPGYAGGLLKKPSYKQVCSGETGHAEVVEICFNPDEISLSDLLRIFFTTHDPTQLNRQGHDVGTQYRSVIFGNDEQRKTAEKIKQDIESSRIWSHPIVTSIEEEDHFWEAEEEHHDYFAKHPEAPYCNVVIAPKVARARKLYRDYFLSGHHKGRSFQSSSSSNNLSASSS